MDSQYLKVLEIYSTALITIKMQIKAIVKYHYKSFSMAQIDCMSESGKYIWIANAFIIQH